MIKRVLVSQPKPETAKSPYFDMESKYNVSIDFKPFIKVEGYTTKEFRQQKIDILSHTAIVFTAKAAVDNFFKIVKDLKIDLSENNMKYFFTTEKLSLYIQKYTKYLKRKVYFGQDGSISSLAEVIRKHDKEKYLIIVSDVYDANKSIDHKNDLISLITSDTKISYTKAVLYRTVSVDFSQEPDFNYDMLCFFSPSGIQSLYSNFPDFVQGNMHIACFGPTTIKAAEDHGLTVNVKAPTEEYPSMTAAIDAYIKETNK